MSATPDSTLADPERLIADLQRQLAERTAERDAALERETATAEVLQVINASPGELVPVFDAILEKAHALCGAAHGALHIYDGELFRPAAMRGLPEPFAERLRQGFRASGNPLPEALLAGERFVHISDLAATHATNPGLRVAIELAGTRTLLGVPLRKDGVLLGLIVAFRPEVRPFTDKQIALLQNFAAQAVIAMENARLLTETREALEQQTATAEVLQVINSSPGNRAPVFDATLEKALALSEASFGLISTYQGDDLHKVVAMRGVPAPLAELLREPLRLGPETAMGRLVRGENFVHFADAADDQGYRLGNPTRRALVELGGARTHLSLPLRKDNVLLGAFTVYRQEVRPFADNQIALLQNFAAQAVIAMENARLITETREALEQQTATAEVFQVINSSPGDLTPVFEAMLEKAARLCDAPSGIFWTFDGEFSRAAALHGIPEPYAEILREPIRLDSKIGLGRARQGQGPVVSLDGAAGESYRAGNPQARAFVDLGRARSIVRVPLLKDGKLLGILTVYRQEVRPFTDKQIALLQNFAAQAVIAMENARLLGELRQRTEEVAELNRGLEARVADQVEELGRVGRLKRFLAPQLAEMIVSQGDEKILESHRREIVVVFCDLRGYTAFTETAEPEEVLEFLREYHGALGPLVSQFEGTLDQFSGDGIMVFFNDPVPCPNPAARAVKMAMAMRDAASGLIAAWRRHGCDLGFGAGIAQGFATLGQIGFSERSGYTAIGTVCNLAARLCAEAKDGQILVSSRIAEAVEAVARLEDLGNLELKGLRRPVAAFNVVQSTNPSESRPNLTVVARGPAT
jgi:class 3 adenylate cyclase